MGSMTMVNPDTGSLVSVQEEDIDNFLRRGYTEEGAGPAYEGDGLESLTVAELRERLAAAELPADGNKAALIERLRPAGVEGDGE